MKREDGSAEAPLGSALLLFVAVLTTIAAAAAAWAITGRPPMIGIDDAAITRNYAENLAQGHGFVYFVGGERVEGATSFLWTLIVALAYLAAPNAPELPIIALSAGLTTAAVFATLSLTALEARIFGAPQRPAIFAAAFALIALPGFFFWSVFTMMELALWSATLLVLVWRLARLVERPKPWSLGVIAAAALLPLIRPEGAAMALGLLVLAALLMGRWPRGLIAAIIATVATTAGLVLFRLIYFGYPVPNTFYAKVSSDRMQDLADGAKYLFSFVSGMPLAGALLALWAAGVVWALWRHFSDRPEGARGLIIGAAAIIGVLAGYALLGGDHFAYWRFYQPIAPLLAVGFALAFSVLVTDLSPRIPALTRAGCVAAAGLVWLAIAYGDLRQARFDLLKEFSLVEQGMAFGRLMNEVAPGSTLGVGPAGGISLTYEGPILDLLGLNWVEMAHANPVKIGMRNHASFDAATFWRHQPDLVAEFNLPCVTTDPSVPSGSAGTLRSLYIEKTFRESYTPIRVDDSARGSCWIGFGRRNWIPSVTDPRLVPLSWSEIRITKAPSPPS